MSAPIAADLLAVRDDPGIIFGWLDFDDAASRHLGKVWRIVLASLLELIFSKETAIGTSRAAIFELEDAADFWFERFADFVKKIGEGRVIRRFVNRFTRGTDVAERGEIRFERGHRGGTLIILCAQ